MDHLTIPLLIEARGDHRQVGRQIGEQMRPHIQSALEKQRHDLPAGIFWEEMLYQGGIYLAHSRAVYPQYIAELEGLAQGADVPFEELFLYFCEELLEAAAWRAGAPRARRGCTDFAARGPATREGHTLLAHTNDLAPENEANLAILIVQAGDEPPFLAVSPGGIGISAGFNAAGIGLTGNQLYNNDIRPGVPRLLMVRAILAARCLKEAMSVCLLPQRASNYNNLIASSQGEVYCMEGSATDCEPIYIAEHILAHTNHYTTLPMRGFEYDRNAIAGSILRYHRAWRLLRENFGQLSPQLFQKLLADHVNYPDSICMHGEELSTVFSLIIDLDERCAWFAPGNPCQAVYRQYRLESSGD